MSFIGSKQHDLVLRTNRSDVLQREKSRRIRERELCHWCGRLLRELHRSQVTWDHLHARAAGGKDTLDNLVLACEPCNVSKADLPAPLCPPVLDRQEFVYPALTWLHSAGIWPPALEQVWFEAAVATHPKTLGLGVVITVLEQEETEEQVKIREEAGIHSPLIPCPPEFIRRAHAENIRSPYPIPKECL